MSDIRDDKKPMLIRLTTLAEGSGSGTAVSNVEHLSCATCKWAAPVGPRLSVNGVEYTHGGDAEFPLFCRRIDSSKDGGMPTHPDALAWAVDTESYYGANLRVAPTFGCVQWEGK